MSFVIYTLTREKRDSSWQWIRHQTLFTNNYIYNGVRKHN